MTPHTPAALLVPPFDAIKNVRAGQDERGAAHRAHVPPRMSAAGNRKRVGQATDKSLFS